MRILEYSNRTLVKVLTQYNSKLTEYSNQNEKLNEI